MQTFSRTVSEASNAELALPYHSQDDRELASILRKQTSTRATYSKVLKLKEVVRALTPPSELRVDELSIALHCSVSAVRKYIRELQNIDVIEIVRYVPDRTVPNGRAVYRIGPNMERAAFITLWDPLRPDKRSGCDDIGALTENSSVRVHILEDDIPYSYLQNKTERSRDPLVAALFGEAS